MTAVWALEPTTHAVTCVWVTGRKYFRHMGTSSNGYYSKEKRTGSLANLIIRELIEDWLA